MGSACCIAARDRTTTLPAATGGGALPRNVTCSPSWSFRWDNHRRVADEVGDSPYLVSRGESRNMSIEFKTSLGSERGTLSEGGSPLGNLVTSTSQKSPPHEEMDKNIMVSPLSERSIASFGSTEVKSLSELPDMTYSSGQKLSFSVSSALSTPQTAAQSVFGRRSSDGFFAADVHGNSTKHSRVLSKSRDFSKPKMAALNTSEARAINANKESLLASSTGEIFRFASSTGEIFRFKSHEGVNLHENRINSQNVTLHGDGINSQNVTLHGKSIYCSQRLEPAWQWYKFSE